MEFVPFILFPIAWVVTYKYFSKKRNKIISHLLGFVFSTIALFISAAIIMPAPTPEQIQQRELAKAEKQKAKEIEEQNKKLEEQAKKEKEEVAKVEKQKAKEIEEQNKKLEELAKKEKEELAKVEQLKAKEIEEQNKKLEEQAKKEKEEVDKAEELKIQKKEEQEKILKSIVFRNANSVADSLEKNYKIKALGFKKEKLDRNKMCISDNFCEYYADNIVLQFVHKTVTANASIKVEPAVYQSTCSGILIGLTGMNKQLSEDIIKKLFYYASLNGPATNEVTNIKIKVKPNISNKLLECSFVKY